MRRLYTFKKERIGSEFDENRRYEFSVASSEQFLFVSRFTRGNLAYTSHINGESGYFSNIHVGTKSLKNVT